MAIKIGIINQKGGVGKTTISNALAYQSSQINNLKTLLIDFDPQASQTILLSLEPKHYLKDHEANIAKIFEKVEIKPLKIKENLDFIPANLELANQSESTTIGKDKMLQKFLNKVEENYDVILIDSNPSFSSLMTNVVLSSDCLLIPIGTSALDEAGAQGFFEIIENIADIYDKFPEKIYVIPTKFDKRRKDDTEVLDILQKELPHYIKSLPNLKKSDFQVLKPIPERAVVKDAAAARLFVHEYIEEYDKNNKKFLNIFSSIIELITNKAENKPKTNNLTDTSKKTKVKVAK